jgi:hypothetical protein
MLCHVHSVDEGWKKISKLLGILPSFGRVALGPCDEPGARRQRIRLQSFNGVNCLTLRYQGEARSTRLAHVSNSNRPHALSSAAGPWLFYCYPVSLFLFFFGYFRLS